MLVSISKYLSLFFKGFLMGAADVVPGVSGGTMAFILGIYEQLIDEISRFGRKECLKPLCRLKFRQALGGSSWGFLLSVAAGILSAALLLAKPLEHMLETHPALVWSFFFGLVAASIFIVAARIKKWSVVSIVLLLLGCALAYLIVGLVPVSTPEDPWFLILSGAVAICAMILPGISGSFLLVLLGKYEFVLNAVNTRDVVSIGYIGIGAVLGLVGFSQVLKVLFAKYHDATVALLTGLMIGSLRKIWPWKIEDINTLPEWNGQTIIFLTAMVVGIGLVFLIEIFHAQSKK